MDGKDRFNALVFVHIAVEQIEINRRHCSLPIVAVDDLRVKIYVLNHFTDSFREKRKPFCIVIEAIDTAIALKVVFIIEKIIFNAAMACFKDAAVLVAPTKRYVEITDKFHLLAQFRFDCAVQRDHHPARVLLAADRAWQGPRHIGQTAGCNEGRRLRCNIQDSHLQIPPLKRLLAVNFLHG